MIFLFIDILPPPFLKSDNFEEEKIFYELKNFEKQNLQNDKKKSSVND